MKAKWRRRRLYFLWLMLCGSGLAGAVLGAKTEDLNFWNIIAISSNAIIAFVGLVMAIKEFPERPGNIGEVLDRAARILEHESGHHRLITLLCEYPAWGALSERNTPAFKMYEEALFQCVAPKAQTRVVLVSPDEGGMEDHIKKYAHDYDLKQEEASAIGANKSMVDHLSVRANRINKWPVKAPRYQMLMISNLSVDNSLTHKQALVWLAPLSSEDLTVDGARMRRRNHVGILAWEITNSEMLTELFECVKILASKKEGETWEVMSDQKFIIPGGTTLTQSP